MRVTNNLHIDPNYYMMRQMRWKLLIHTLIIFYSFLPSAWSQDNELRYIRLNADFMRLSVKTTPPNFHDIFDFELCRTDKKYDGQKCFPMHEVGFILPPGQQPLFNESGSEFFRHNFGSAFTVTSFKFHPQEFNKIVLRFRDEDGNRLFSINILNNGSVCPLKSQKSILEISKSFSLESENMYMPTSATDSDPDLILNLDCIYIERS